MSFAQDLKEFATTFNQTYHTLKPDWRSEEARARIVEAENARLSGQAEVANQGAGGTLTRSGAVDTSDGSGGGGDGSVKGTSINTNNVKSIPTFVAGAGQPYGVGDDYLAKTTWIESRGNPRAVSPSGAKGLM